MWQCQREGVGKAERDMRSVPMSPQEGLSADTDDMFPPFFLLCSPDDRDTVCALLCSPFRRGPGSHHLLRLLLPLLLQ